MEKDSSKDKLSHRVIKSGFWLSMLNIVNKAFAFIRLIILARLLAPKDFGLMGIAVITLSILEVFSRTGFYTALVQKIDEVDLYLDSAWTFSVIRGFVLFGILFFVAPHAAHFFSVPHAKPIIRVIGFSFLFDAFTSAGVIFFRRELEFDKLFIYNLAGTLADFAVAVSCAYIFKNVWALVFGKLSGSAIRTIASYLLHPYRPKIDLNWGQARELFGFGKWILGSSIVLFLLGQGGDIVVGKLLGATMLGFYNIGSRLPNLLANEVSRVISQVTFPAFSKLQKEIIRLREAYLKVLQVTAFFAFPLMGFIIVLASDFTRIFLGEKWLPIVPVMQVLSCWGLVYSLGSATGSLFKAIGRPDLETKLQGANLVILAIIIYPLTLKWGMLGTAMAVFLNTLLVTPFAFYLTIKITRCGVHEFLKMLYLPLISVLVMISSIIFLKNKIFQQVGLVPFFIIIILGGTIYLGLMNFIDIFTTYGLRASVHEYITSMKKSV